MSEHRADTYYVEHNGDCWQSVFPHWESELSQLHESVDDAIAYIREKVGHINIVTRARLARRA